MINEFYKNFKVRDYMNEEILKIAQANDVIDCSLGTNPFMNENIIKECVKQSTYEINKYPSIEYEKLKEQLLDFWNKQIGKTIDKENIAFGSGTMGMLRNISQFLIDQGTKILGCAPQFPRFISEVELRKGIYECVNLKKENNYKFIVDDFLNKINGAYQVISIENPNNPTGQIIDVYDIEEIVKKAKQYDIFVIVDEAYGDYMSLENSAITLVDRYNNLMVLRSASKYFGLPNHRIGYLFADKEIVKIYNEIALPFPFSDLSASIFTKILKRYEELEETKLKTMTVNEKIYKALKKTDYIYTSLETPIFTIRTDKYENLTKKLSEKGMIAESCGYFINLDDRYARIRIHKDYEKIIKILLEVL